MREAVFRFAKNNRGATAIEYGLIAAAVALGIAAAVAGMGGNIGGVFGTLSQRLAPTESSVAPQAPNVPQAPNAPLFRTPSRDRGNLVIID